MALGCDDADHSESYPILPKEMKMDETFKKNADYLRLQLLKLIGTLGLHRHKRETILMWKCLNKLLCKNTITNWKAQKDDNSAYKNT